MGLNIIPNSGQSLDETRDPIRNNFTYINTGFIQNHVELNTGANSGKHKFLQMPVNAAPTTLASEIGLYADNGATSGNPELFFRPEVDGTPRAITEGTNAANGWSRLPSGVIMKWFTGSINGGGNVTIDLNSVGPNYATLYNIVTGITGAAGDTNSLYIQSSTTAQIVLYRANNATGPARTYYVSTLGV